MRVKAIQLPLQTFILISGFMLWVILSSLMSFIKEDIFLTAGQQTLVTAVPVILGSLLRIPIGFWTNRYGARKVTLISFLLLLFPVFYISVADSFADLLIGGFLLGLSGAIFSAGVTSLPKYYPKERHGFVNGIYGMGNIGTAITTFSAPFIAGKIGWQATVQLFLILIFAVLLAAFLFGDKNEAKVTVSLKEQIL
ncbi:MAG: MFS transporter, partial [Bacillales bacterium]